jgi:hypothetical protein
VPSDLQLRKATPAKMVPAESAQRKRGRQERQAFRSPSIFVFNAVSQLLLSSRRRKLVLKIQRGPEWCFLRPRVIADI